MGKTDHLRNEVADLMMKISGSQTVGGRFDLQRGLMKEEVKE